MVKDFMEYAERCEVCQYHANFIHRSPKSLHLTIVSWPFYALGIDVVGPIHPKSSTSHAYIMATMITFQSGQKLHLVEK